MADPFQRPKRPTEHQLSVLKHSKRTWDSPDDDAKERVIAWHRQGRLDELARQVIPADVRRRLRAEYVPEAPTAPYAPYSPYAVQPPSRCPDADSSSSERLPEPLWPKVCIVLGVLAVILAVAAAARFA